MIFSPVPSSLHVGRVRGEKWSPAEGRKRPGVATANLAHQGHSQSNMCPPPHRFLPQAPFQQPHGVLRVRDHQGLQRRLRNWSTNLHKPPGPFLSEVRRD